MILLIVAFLTFLFYYLACFDFTNSKKKLWFIICFIVSSFLLRAVIDPTLNNDFYLYFNFKIFHKPTDFLSYLVREPYLYLVYSFFDIFSDDKEVVFSCLYWFNYLITTIFFVWLVKRKDVEVWKKMLIFSFFYFFFAFVLLRNGPVYLLFALCFYYNFRDLKFNYVLLTPFMHISAIAVLIVYFHKWKNYYLFFVVFCILGPMGFIIFHPYLLKVDAFQTVALKIDYFSSNNAEIGMMHWLFFAFISILFLLAAKLYRKQLLHPIIISSAFFYYVTYFINPIMAFRFSPYVLFALLFFNVDILKKQIVRILNLLSVFLFVIFLFILYHTHHL